MMRFDRPPHSVQDVSIICLICHKFRCGFHALPRIARMLVDPVLGTSTKMHLCLCEITALLGCVWEYSSRGSAGTRTRNQRLKRALLYRLSYRPVKVEFVVSARFFNLEPTPNTFGAALPIELPTHAGSFCKVHRS